MPQTRVDGTYEYTDEEIESMTDEEYNSALGRKLFITGDLDEMPEEDYVLVERWTEANMPEVLEMKRSRAERVLAEEEANGTWKDVASFVFNPVTRASTTAGMVVDIVSGAGRFAFQTGSAIATGVQDVFDPYTDASTTRIQEEFDEAGMAYDEFMPQFPRTDAAQAVTSRAFTTAEKAYTGAYKGAGLPVREQQTPQQAFSEQAGHYTDNKYLQFGAGLIPTAIETGLGGVGGLAVKGVRAGAQGAKAAAAKAPPAPTTRAEAGAVLRSDSPDAVASAMQVDPNIQSLLDEVGIDPATVDPALAATNKPMQEMLAGTTRANELQLTTAKEVTVKAQEFLNTLSDQKTTTDFDVEWKIETARIRDDLFDTAQKGYDIVDEHVRPTDPIPTPATTAWADAKILEFKGDPSKVPDAAYRKIIEDFISPDNPISSFAKTTYGDKPIPAGLSRQAAALDLENAPKQTRRTIENVKAQIKRYVKNKGGLLNASEWEITELKNALDLDYQTFLDNKGILDADGQTLADIHKASSIMWAKGKQVQKNRINTMAETLKKSITARLTGNISEIGKRKGAGSLEDTLKMMEDPDIPAYDETYRGKKLESTVDTKKSVQEGLGLALDVYLDDVGLVKGMDLLNKDKSGSKSIFKRLPTGAEKRLNNMATLARLVEERTTPKGVGPYKEGIKHPHELIDETGKIARSLWLNIWLRMGGNAIGQYRGMRTPGHVKANTLLRSEQFMGVMKDALKSDWVYGEAMPSTLRAKSARLMKTKAVKDWLASLPPAAQAQVTAMGLLPYLLTPQREEPAMQ